MTKVGDYIKIIYMNGEPQYSGRTGYVERIDSLGQIHGSWGGCALIQNVDEFEVLNKNTKCREQMEKKIKEKEYE